jgi:RNA polymerase sigma factor (TIGR02999 family)
MRWSEIPFGHGQVDISMNMPSTELYQELRAIAKRFMNRERKDHTLSPTDLLHEAYTRLCPLLSSSTFGNPELDVANHKAETLPSLFAITMRRVLIDHARKRARRSVRLKRVGWIEPSDDSDCGTVVEKGKAASLLELDEVLTRFAIRYPLYAKVVELKFFGGLTVVQCAEEIGVCPATAQRYWNFARAWIAREMDRIELE